MPASELDKALRAEQIIYLYCRASLVFDRYPFERKNFIKIILIALGREIGFS